MNNYVAADIGASSGRIMLANINNGKIVLQEIHRFANGFVTENGQEVWEIDKLLKEILVGLAKLKKMGVTSCTLGIDTWGVDYVLVGKDGKRLKSAVCYRDSRTDGAIEEVAQIMDKETLYNKTGINFLQFNTIYQLYREPSNVLDKTKYVLLTPDYLAYELTGQAVTEYTMATTTGLLDCKTKVWDNELLSIAGVRTEQFAPFANVGDTLGNISQKWVNEYDLPMCKVIVAPTHDTAAAVVATTPLKNANNGNWAFLSSGTWSLLGMEVVEPIITKDAMQARYSNEGGAYNTYRFLTNITGMWLIEEIRRNLGTNIDYAYLLQEAKKVPHDSYFIDVSHRSFLNPDNMITAIQQYCKTAGTKIPQTPGELARCVYDSLATFYKISTDRLEQLTNKTIDQIVIIGGGSKNYLLNEITAQKTNKTIVAGLAEATALGNIISQLIAMGEVADVWQGRELVGRSFESGVWG